MIGDDELERLLSVPLSGFVEERQRLVAALKAAGRRDDARELGKLAKPSVAVWVVNQLAREEAAEVKRLGELTASLQAAPAAEGYARLVGEHRDALKSLRAAAERILVAAGQSATPALLERIAHTLRAGMTHEATRATIERGQLLREVGELDFASLVGAPGAPGPGTVPPAREAPSRARAPATRSKAQEPELSAREQASAREALAQTRERARARAAAEAEAERLRAKAAAARKRLVEAEAALETTRRAVANGEARVAAARRETEAVADELDAAEEAARALSLSLS